MSDWGHYIELCETHGEEPRRSEADRRRLGGWWQHYKELRARDTEDIEAWARETLAKMSPRDRRLIAMWDREEPDGVAA